MNRNDEYQLLLNELHSTPPALEYTLQRAVTKAQRRQRTARFVGIPAGTLLGLLAGFVLMVNLAPGFAFACGQVRGLKELAQAVAWSPSLAAAVENEYVQPVEQTRESNGFSVTVQYVIVDRTRLNIYYTLNHGNSADSDVYVRCDLKGLEDQLMGISGTRGENKKNIQSFTVDFQEQVPSELDLTLTVYTPYPGTTLAEIPFHLTFDPDFTAQGETIFAGKDFSLDGQRFSLTEVSFYPTHTRIRIEPHSDNTFALEYAELYLENERGERFEAAKNSILLDRDADGKGMTFFLDSTYFSRSEMLALYITEVRWQDRPEGRIRVDLSTGTTENLPERIRFLGAKQKENGWYLWFTARTAKTDPAPENFGFRGIFSNQYWDTQGNAFISMGRSIYNGLYDPFTEEQTMKNSGQVTELVVLTDYTDTAVWLVTAYQPLTEPVRLVIKGRE